MAPAGHWPQLRAAIEAGADSVYFGLKHFTARAKVGFSIDELPEAMRTLHRRGVRGFLTFNTLVWDHELESAAVALARIAEAQVDAIIVQDLGVLRLAREIAPDLEIHASTQMSVTDAAGARLAAAMGASRVTLARELSLAEIRRVAAEADVELEVFVHGALCVAYSGQCFSSEAWGGRSANRGQCAQACRLPYDMFVDGRLEPLGDARYLLSPGDLYALKQVPELIEIGAAAFKIEGRYKEAEYVAAATRAYRQAVDEAWAGRALSITPAEELELEQVYSRGMGPYFLTGTNHQAVVRGRAPRHRGVLLGRVAEVSSNCVFIDPAPANSLSPLKPGDGVVFDSSGWRSPQEDEEGGRVFSVVESKGRLRLEFGNDAIRFSRIRPGDLLWRTDDPALEKRLRAFTHAETPLHKQPVNVLLDARPVEPLRLEWTLAAHPTLRVHLCSSESLRAAANRGLTPEFARRQLERLGNTPYELARLDTRIEGLPFVPASLLNQLRREAVDRLQALQESPPLNTLREPHEALRSVFSAIRRRCTPREPPSIHLLVRTPEQLEAAIELAPSSITLDYLDLYGLKPSVERLQQTGIEARVASPRIVKPGEERIADFLSRLGCGILVRPLGLLEVLRGLGVPRLSGDFSLNAANAITASILLEMGLERITPTHDLNAAQITALAAEAGGGVLEAIAYQHLPVFHTEHCAFARFLSNGTSYHDCGRPCEKHRVELRDPSGRRHPLMADAGCRNTLFGAEAQQAARHLEDWLAAGIVHFRLEFVHESPEQVAQVTEAFRAALGRRISFAALDERLARIAPQGATEGSLFIPADHLALPILQ
ncbi:MAG: U32 family peptidase [Bryobacteraceae bacterium]|nr:U32 family peptidase [Bryobacteraceae bacterium]